MIGTVINCNVEIHNNCLSISALLVGKTSVQYDDYDHDFLN